MGDEPYGEPALETFTLWMIETCDSSSILSLSTWLEQLTRYIIQTFFGTFAYQPRSHCGMRWDHFSRSPKRRFCMSSHQGAQPCVVLELGSLRTKALAVLWRKECASFYFPQKASHLRDCGTPAQLQMLLQYSHFPFSLTFQTLQAVNLALPQHPTGLCYEVKVRTKIYTYEDIYLCICCFSRSWHPRSRR